MSGYSSLFVPLNTICQRHALSHIRVHVLLILKRILQSLNIGSEGWGQKDLPEKHSEFVFSWMYLFVLVNVWVNFVILPLICCMYINVCHLNK